MGYLEIIQENLDDIFVHIRQSIHQDEALREFTGNQEKLETFIKAQEDILKRYLCDFESDIEVDEHYYWEFYRDLDIPYSVVYNSIQLLRSLLMQVIVQSITDKSKCLQIDTYLHRMIECISKIYIKKNIYVLKEMNKSAFRNYLLFRSHLDFIESLIYSIEQDDLKNFPLNSAESCQFHEQMHYPESLMVCMDTQLCTYLYDIHVLVHKRANTFYLFYKKGEYIQAHIAFKELIEIVMNFNRNITELYFLTYAHAEESMLRLLEQLLYKEKNIYLTLIDFKGLHALNAMYGEKTVNQILSTIDTHLQKIVHDREDKILLVKGTTANYYMLNIGLDESLFAQILSELYTTVNCQHMIDHKEIMIEAVVASLQMGFFQGNTHHDFRKLLLHLKEEAKMYTTHHLVFEKSDLQELQNWLISNQQNLNFIIEKLQQRAIDVMFQPIFNIHSGEYDSLEVLARIKDGTHYIPAGRFIQSIYSLGKIEELDLLVLDKIQEYQQEINLLSKKLFINVSYTSLQDLRYQKKLEQLIETFGNEQFIFELTEQNIVENTDLIVDLHQRFGIQFAVDDFGSGFSSLKMVSDLTAQGILKVLKIDGSLIKNIDTHTNDCKIVANIAKLCRSLEIDSVAEFIEKKSILDKLSKMGITYAQGYLLSEPKLLDQILVETLNGMTPNKII